MITIRYAMHLAQCTTGNHSLIYHANASKLGVLSEKDGKGLGKIPFTKCWLIAGCNSCSNELWSILNLGHCVTLTSVIFGSLTSYTFIEFD